MLMPALLVIAGTILSLAMLAGAIWIVLPPRSYPFWLVAVGAPEASLWLMIGGLLGCLLGASAWRVGVRWWALPSLVGGALAMALATIPTTQAYIVAADAGVELSLTRYLFGALSSEPAVEETRDVVYAEVEGRALRLDVYRPADRGSGDEGLPAIVSVHGGSWSGGARGEVPELTQALVAGGRVVFDVEYRLAGPEQRFPAQVADVKCAIAWVKRNASLYGVDPGRVGLLGRSAGGQLALLAAYAAGDPALPSSCGAGDTSVQAVISFYAPVDLVWGYNHPARPGILDSSGVLRNYLGGTPSTAPARYHLASPLTHVAPTSPPTLVFHGERDYLVGKQHADFLEAALRTAGIPHRIVLLPWAGHGFDWVARGWGAQIAQGVMEEFLNKYL